MIARRRAAALAVAAVLGLTGCTGPTSDAPTAGPADTPTDGELSGTLTVFAAASLTDVFTDLGEILEADHSGLAVRFNFAGSSTLATQIVQGAPADVFASADQPQMDVVVDADLEAADATVFAENVLEIAVPADNPGGVTSLGDFADPDLTLAICAPEVPCGMAAATVFEAAGVVAVPDSLEEDVRAALTKVEIGEVDAALVYATDVQSAGSAVRGIQFPEAERAVNEYPACVLADAPNPAAADAFLDLVVSPVGRGALEAAGFRVPSA